MTNVFYGGFDTRQDIDGIRHPWRLLVTDGKGRVYQRQIRLPPGKTWLNLPRDPVWGDLLLKGESIEEQIASLAQQLPADSTLHLHGRHNNPRIDRALRWQGIEAVFHDAEIVNADPLRISGEAGCEIGSLMSHQSLKQILESV